MPIIKNKPRTMEDGTNIISYTDSVGTDYVTYTFENNQELLQLTNKGLKPIEYVVGSQSGTLQPGESQNIAEVFSSFQVKASQGVQQFEIRADEEGTKGVSNGAIQSLDTKVTELSSSVAHIPTLKRLGAKGDGTTDDTLKIQSAFDNHTQILITEGTYKITNGLTINHPMTIINNGGEIQVDSSFAQKKGITILSDDVTIEGLHISNPTEAKSQTGGKNTGISIKGNRVKVIGCTVEKFLHGIVVEPTGEYFDTIITNNFVKDNLGAGDGALNLTSAYGEDRGDGILSWGASSVITNNIVTCKEGQDARIGIHVESLPSYEVNSPLYSDTSSIISNNIVRGSFRRGIVNEGLANVTISDNVISGGQTWWGIAVASNARFTSIEGNTILFDRDTNNKSGQVWSPKRGAIALTTGDTNYPSNINITGNIVNVIGDGSGLSIADANHNTSNINIKNNIFHCTNALKNGLGIVDAEKIYITNNTFYGFLKAIDVYGVSDFIISNNKIENSGDRAIYVQNATLGNSIIKDNSIFSCQNGIEVASSSDVNINGNTLKNIATVALTVWNLSNGQVVDNVLQGSYGTAFSKGGTTFIQARNNLGFAIDESVLSSHITSATSNLNTKWKYRGKIVITDTNNVYISLGSEATSQWKKIEDGSLVTPA